MRAILLHLATTLTYASLSLIIWQQLRAPSVESLKWAKVKPWVNFLTLIPIGLHIALTYHYSLGFNGLHLGLGNFTSLIVATTCLIYASHSLWAGENSLPALSLPFGAIASLLPLLDGASVQIPHSELSIFKIHLMLSVVAYSLLSVSLIHTLMMSYLEKSLHQHKFSPLIENLPPLLKLETLLFTILLLGFLTLSAALVSGIFISLEIQSTILPINHKTIFSIASWLLFASLLIGRHLLGWRGKVARKILVIGFLLLIIAYFGSRFVSEIILQNPQY
ncbi:MAG: cytochrome c biogenesis protein CcsA [Proteobacteria bacterium]|nr:cytochrome c biogenesis protein CcsA [Pseudomonadota bacterium]MDA1331079.1 cytochrome c biogenesis protein CcsA [Pseudomonadota bacterium]